MYTIISACVLHNITLVGDEDIFEFFDDDDGKGGSMPTDHQPTNTTDDAAQRKRAAQNFPTINLQLHNFL